MPVAYDATAPSSTGTAVTGTSLSWSHTASSSATHIFVVATVGVKSSPSVIPNVKCNGAAMMQVARMESNNDTTGFVVMFATDTVSAGANSIALTTTASGVINAGSVSFTGAGSWGTPKTAYGSSATPTVTLTGTTAGNMVIDGVGNGDHVLTSNQTMQWHRSSSSAYAAGCGGCSTALAGGAVTMSYNVDADWWGMVAVEVIAAGPAPVTVDTAQFFPFF